MKRKNLLILSIICIISLSIFAGLLVYAFDIQSQRDTSFAGDKDNAIGSEDKDLAGTSSVGIADNGNVTSDGTSDNLIASSDGTDDNSITPSDGTDDNSITSSDGTDDNSITSSDETDDNSIAPSDETNNKPSTSSGRPGNSESSSSPGVSNNSKDTISAALPGTINLAQADHASTEPIILGFAGDVNLDESYYPVKKYDSVDQAITKCFSTDLLNEMNSANIMMLNNEFSYSTRGKKTPDKSFTFRAKPSRVEILQKMGVDIVSLANNHALDYGPDSLLDTFNVLDNAGINYVGAGKNLERAKAPIYYTVGTKKIAYVAASRVIFAMDWFASENGLGMVGTYDPAILLTSIKEAAANSDFVVVFVHWGIERDTHPAAYQRTLAQQYIDAGADAVIGCHPHVMQGLEFYKGKPIAYSLGNYWFNATKQKSGMLKLYLEPDNTVKVQMLPVMNNDTFTYLLNKKASTKDYFDTIEELSYNVSIDKNGFVTEN